MRNLPRIASAFVLAMVLAGTAAGAGGKNEGGPCLRWKVVPSPGTGDGWNALTGVSARSSKDAWAVGWWTSDVVDEFTYALHWDGTAWTIVPTPNAPPNREIFDMNYLLDVAVVGRTEAWAVGYHYDDDAHIQPLAMHWDGVAWSLVPVPPRPPGAYFQYRLNSVAGASPDDVWAVGWATGEALILHWDGSSWSVSPSPRPSGSGSSILYDLDVRSANDVWAVGNRTGRPLVEHWNGRRWRIVRTSTFAKMGGGFRGVASTSPGKAWAVGWHGAYEDFNLAARWNGRSWSIARTPHRKLLYNNLHDVDAIGKRNVWAVGLVADAVDEYIVPAVYRWNGRRWVRGSAERVRRGVLWSINLLNGQDGWAVGWGPDGPLTERLTRC